MAVNNNFNFIFKNLIKNLNLQYKNRLRLGLSGYSQLFFYSFLFCYPSFSYATPDLRGVVGGNSAATVNTQGLTTNVNQFQSSVIIDWNSLDLAADEKLAIHQLNTDTLLNRIHSATATDIYGQITGAGTNLFVNPNGVFFRPGSRVDVGALIASGLQISNSDFLNGDYIFNEVMGSDGFVINSGLINASLGGSVALLGKQVTNDGVISAQLGSVNLAAGKAAVLTFDQQGLLGVQVTEAILQDELGVDPAVLNSGKINAEGGKVLLTASVSQDVFSQAVNSGDIEQATSVVVNEDGTFTLGSGADVVNTGSVDVSAADISGGEIVMLGENVTSSGVIKADSSNNNGGEIELHSADTTLLTENSVTSARSENNGKGGTVKVLGNKVGLFDQSVVDVAGANGGGQALIGGDYQGLNKKIKNAAQTYVSKDSSIFADALVNGDAGKTIIWADNSTQFYGSVFSRGGLYSGDGGFTEISGKDYLDFTGMVDSSSIYGVNGKLLLDPEDIIVRNSGGSPLGSNTLAFTTNPTGLSIITATSIQTLLVNNDVALEARADILVDDTITVASSSDTGSLTLRAGDDIQIDDNITLGSGDLNIYYDDLCAGSSCLISDMVDTGGDSRYIFLLRANLTTAGGNITLGRNGSTQNMYVFGGSSVTRTISTGNAGGNIVFNTDVLNFNTDNPTSLSLNAGTGDVRFDNSSVAGTSGNSLNQFTITNAGTAELNAVNTDSTINIKASTINLNGSVRSDQGANAGDITLEGSVVIKANLNIDASGGDDGTVIITGTIDDDAGNVYRDLRIRSGSKNTTITQAIGQTTALNSFFISSANIASVKEINTRNGGVIITASSGINLEGDILTNSLATDGGLVDINGAVTLNSDVTINTNGSNTSGTVDFSNTVVSDASSRILTIDAGTSTIVFSNDIGTNGSNNIGGLDIVNASSVDLGKVRTGSSLTGALGIDINATTINLSDDLDTSLDASPGSILLTGDVVLTGNIAVQTGDATSFNITGSLNSEVGNTRDIEITAGTGSITFEKEIGNLADQRLGLFRVLSAGAINLGTLGDVGGLEADSVDIQGSLSFNNNDFAIDTFGVGTSAGGSVSIVSSTTLDVGDIDTSGGQVTGNTSGVSGGTVSLTAADVSVNKITATGGDANGSGTRNGGAGGLITLTAIENAGNQTITLNDDLSALGGAPRGGVVGTSPAAQILLDSSNTPGGTVNLRHTAAPFTSNLAITGSTGIDTLSADAKPNTWNITGNASGNNSKGDLNTNISFIDMENLTGGIADDTFNFTYTSATEYGAIDGLIDGKNGTDNDIINLFFGAGTTTVNTNVEFNATVGAAGDGVAGNGALEINNIETVRASTLDSNTLSGPDNAISWYIGGGGSGSIGGSGLISAPAEGQIIFSGFNTLSGGTAADIFTVTAAYSSNTPMTINGGISATSTEYDTLDLSATSVNSDWTLSSAINGTIVSGTAINLAFTDAENLTASSVAGDTLTANFANDNTWTISNNGGSDVGSGILQDTSDLAGAGPYPTTTFKNIESITGGTAVDIFDIQSTAEVSGTISGGADNDVFNIVNPITLGSLQGAGGDDTFNINALDVAVAINGGANTDTLNGADFENTWTVDGTNNQVAATGGGTVTFQAVEELVGGSGDDTFNFTATGTAALVDGGGGTTNTITGKAAANNWLLSAANEGSVNVGGTDYITSFIGIEEITGGSLATDTLTAFNNDNTWTLSSASGTIENTVGGAVLIDFSAIETITGGDMVDIFNIQATSDVANINGANGADTFNVLATGITASLNGGSDASADTLVGPDGVTNTWFITNGEIGTLNTNISFDEFENLTGGDGVDSFNFTYTSATVYGFIDGLINGASNASPAINDVINLYTNVTTATRNTTVQFGATSGTLGNGVLEINNIETLTADTIDSNTLTGPDANTNWFISGAESGSVGGATLTTVATQGATIFNGFDILTGSNEFADTFTISTTIATGITINGGTSVIDASDTARFDTVIGPDIPTGTTWAITQDNSGTIRDTVATTLIATFNDTENLTAGSGDDTFSFNVGFDVDGDIDAGLGNDDIDLSNLPIVSFDIAGGFGGARIGFETVTGNGYNSTLIGASSGTNYYIWDITAENSGTITEENGDTLNFANFNNLTGNVGDDTFNIIDNTIDNTGGNITGLIDGGAGPGTNILNVNITGTGTATTGKTVQLEGVAGDNEFVADDPADSNFNNYIDVANLSTINANSTYINIIRGGNNANDWDLNGNRSGIYNTNTTFNGFEQLRGGTGSDTFNVTATTLTDLITVYGGDANSNNDELVGFNVTSIWTLNGNNAGTLVDDDAAPSVDVNVAFVNVGNLTGDNTAVDTFNIATGANFSGVIDGGTGAGDTITNQLATATSWTIDMANGGDLIGVLTNFTNIENLNGTASAKDTFTLADGGSITGNVSGGASTTDELINTTSAESIWAISGTNGGTVDSINTFDEIENLTGTDNVKDTFNIQTGGSISGTIEGGAADDDVIVNQLAVDTTWNITANSQGNMFGVINNFTGIESLTGAANVVDTYNLQNAGLLNGTITGGGGVDINGDAIIDQITNQRTAATDWSITGADRGTVNGINLFTGIAKLNGADDTTDTFFITEAGTISNSINGGSGLNVDAITSQRITTTDWSITGLNQGTVTGITLFTGVETLTGSAAIDNFSLDGGTLNTTIDGGDGDDTLTASDANGTNTWVLTAGANRGNVNGLDTANSNAAYDFINIENLTGNAQDDTFTFQAGSSIAGLIDGAGELRDINNDLIAYGDQVDLRLLTGKQDVVLGIGYTDIETFTGNGDALSIFVARSGTDNDWRIFDVPDIIQPDTVVEDQGTVTALDTGDVVTFFNFLNITGGDQVDNFLVEEGSNISLAINGGDGNDNLDLSAQTGIIDRTVGDTLNTGAASVISVEGIRGNANLGIDGNYSILRVTGNTASAWTIDGLNTGEVTAGSDTTRFTNFNILQGGDADDTFEVTVDGSIIDPTATTDLSRINGGEGDDILTVNLSGTNPSAIVNLFSADGFVAENTVNFSTVNSPGARDQVVINGATAGFETATYSVDYSTGIATHSYENTATGATALIAYSDVTTISSDFAVNDAVQADNLIISGTNDNANSNIVTLTGNGEGAGNFDLSRSTTNPIDWADVDYSNKQSLTVRNLGVGGTITAMSNIDVNTTSGFIDFSASNINTGNRTLTANELRLDSVTGDIASNSPILTDVTNLQVTSSSANIYISENSGLNLIQVDTTGLLSIIADGTITDGTTQALTSSGNLSLRTINNNANNIIIDNVLNNLTGTITLNTEDGATATLVNAGSETLLGASSVGLTGTLNVTSTNGSITTNDQTIVAGTANLSSSADIILTNTSNDFTTLSIATAVSADIHDTNDLILGNVAINAGTLQITADSIDQVNGTSIVQSPNLFDGSAGNITFNIGAGIIDLGNLTNNFIGDVALNNSGEFFVEIADVNDIQFAASNIGSGTFTVNSNGRVSQSGRISQETPANINTSAVAINAGIGEIDLTNINNNFTGTINLINTSNATVALTNLNNIVLDGANVGGQFNVTARGGFDISQVALLTVVGNASFTVDAGRSIILDDNMNDLQGGVSFNSNNGLALFDVTIFNNRALELGDINVSNNLDVLANGEITNTGVLTVGEVAWFDATNNNITVDNPSNNFNNIVLLNANTVTINDVDSINIGSTIAGRTDSTVAVDLNITTATGNIFDVANSTLTVGGVSNLTAGSLANAGNIQLDETSNEFNQVNIINAQDVTLFDLDTDANGIDLRSSNIAGNLVVTSTGDITNSDNALSGALVVNGTSSFTTADGGDILLINSANELTGALTFAATTNGVALNNVGIVNTLATNINALNITTDLSITSGGAITQNAAFTVGNLTTLDAINTSTLVPQDIILESPNNLNLLTILNANNVTIKNATNTLSIDQLNAAGAIDIMSGALTITDDIVASSVALDSGAGLTNIASVNTTGSLSINSEGLTVNGTVDAGDAIINAGGAAAAFFGDITTGTTLDVTANGLTLNGAIETGGDTVLDATTGVANLNNSITVLTGDLTVNGNGINQPENILVQNDVTLNSTQGIAMDAASSTTATDGSIQYNADNTVNVALLSAVNGTAGVNTSTNIVDANGDLVNFLATNMVTRTGTGVGTEADPIETQVSTLDVINSGSGSVWIDQANAGDLEIIALQNDTVRTSIDDPGGTTVITTDENYLINPNSIIVDRDTGILRMTTTGGNFVGTGTFKDGIDPLTTPDGSLINPDITANQATFFGVNGDFGNTFRPLVLNVPELFNPIPDLESVVVINTRRVAARYHPQTPVNLFTTGVDISALGALNAIAGELLVEIESLGDIDPAIFTNLQNYSLQDVSIRMPRDQLFEDELEEDGQLQ